MPLLLLADPTVFLCADSSSWGLLLRYCCVRDVRLRVPRGISTELLRLPVCLLRCQGTGHSVVFGALQGLSMGGV